MNRRFLAALGFLCFGLLASMYAPSALAEYATRAAAMADCKAYAAGLGGNTDPYWVVCVDNGKNAQGMGEVDAQRSTDGQAYSGYPYTWDANDVNPCYQAPTNSFGQGKVLEGYSVCGQKKDQASGATLRCSLSVTPLGRPTLGPSGQWQTYMRISSSGNLCGASESDGFKDKTGTPVTPSPPTPTLPTVEVNAAPSECGGLSCYNSASDKYCATSGGAQFCVTGALARTAAGSCTNSGDASICSGTPSPTKRPTNPPITDPATQIQGIDVSKTADPKTGAETTTSTIIYSKAPGAVTSGQQAGDSGPKPASSSTAPTNPDGGSASGGGDCNSPPVCAGNAPTCAAVSQVWLSRCGSSLADKNADGKPDWVDVTAADGDVYSTSTVESGQVFQTATVDGTGVSEQSFAGNTCPTFDAGTGWVSSFVPDSLLFCRWLAIIRAIVIFMGGVAAALILAKES